MFKLLTPQIAKSLSSILVMVVEVLKKIKVSEKRVCEGLFCNERATLRKRVTCVLQHQPDLTFANIF